jgi:hypothetical protein
MSQQEQPTSTDALRAEHDALARQLASRASVDALRRALGLGSLGFLSGGVCWAILWDRYGAQPSAFAVEHGALFHAGYVAAAVVALTLFALTGVILARWRRLARREDAQFARLLELRRAVGIDP